MWLRGVYLNDKKNMENINTYIKCNNWCFSSKYMECFCLISVRTHKFCI